MGLKGLEVPHPLMNRSIYSIFSKPRAADEVLTTTRAVKALTETSKQIIELVGGTHRLSRRDPFAPWDPPVDVCQRSSQVVGQHCLPS